MEIVLPISELPPSPHPYRPDGWAYKSGGIEAVRIFTQGEMARALRKNRHLGRLVNNEGHLMREDFIAMESAIAEGRLVTVWWPNGKKSLAIFAPTWNCAALIRHRRNRLCAVCDTPLTGRIDQSTCGPACRTWQCRHPGRTRKKSL